MRPFIPFLKHSVFRSIKIEYSISCLFTSGIHGFLSTTMILSKNFLFMLDELIYWASLWPLLQVKFLRKTKGNFGCNISCGKSKIDAKETWLGRDLADCLSSAKFPAFLFFDYILSSYNLHTAKIEEFYDRFIIVVKYLQPKFPLYHVHQILKYFMQEWFWWFYLISYFTVHHTQIRW